MSIESVRAQRHTKVRVWDVPVSRQKWSQIMKEYICFLQCGGVGDEMGRLEGRTKKIHAN